MRLLEREAELGEAGIGGDVGGAVLLALRGAGEEGELELGLVGVGEELGLDGGGEPALGGGVEGGGASEARASAARQSSGAAMGHAAMGRNWGS